MATAEHVPTSETQNAHRTVVRLWTALHGSKKCTAQRLRF